MARVSNKHDRDQNLDFQGFLNDLQDWELSLGEKDKKMKAQSHEEKKVGTSSQKIGIIGEHKGPTRKAPSVDYSRSNIEKFNYSRGSDAISRISSSFVTEESSPDAVSEKELGNEYFKQKKYKDAIDCYSRSIALSPTAVAFANRAMAYLKIRRFEEAENDCTEALNLDDRYIKAYSRRATARKELGKLKASIEDSEFALRLEPRNQELKKQYDEAKALYEKEILDKASGAIRNSTIGAQKGVTPVKSDHIEDSGKPLVVVNEIDSRPMTARSKSGGQESDGSEEGAVQSSGTDSSKIGHSISKKEPKTSVQELASRAASQAMAEAAKNMTLPNTAYQFEVSWRGISSDRALQARLLKAISPTTLPQLFRNALSAPILIDIIKCIATFYMEETELAVKFLANLTKVSRFDMIIMCLSAADRDDLHKIWKEVFSNEAVPIEFTETLSKLRPKYCLGG